MCMKLQRFNNTFLELKGLRTDRVFHWLVLYKIQMEIYTIHVYKVFPLSEDSLLSLFL